MNKNCGMVLSKIDFCVSEIHITEPIVHIITRLRFRYSVHLFPVFGTVCIVSSSSDKCHNARFLSFEVKRVNV
jgi:hypothetical protein